MILVLMVIMTATAGSKSLNDKFLSAMQSAPGTAGQGNGNSNGDAVSKREEKGELSNAEAGNVTHLGAPDATSFA
jgi:hypothetical protein